MLFEHSGSVEAGQFWRRKSDGVMFEVVFVNRHRRVQMRRAGAKNLKNTNWLDEWNMLNRYEPAETPPPPTLAERIREELAIPGDPSLNVEVKCNYGWSAGTSWAVHAVEFAKLAEDVSWRWMNVPANAKRAGTNGWFSLWVYGTIGGVRIELDGGSGWDKPAADILTAELRAASVVDDESRTPFPYAYEEAKNCAA